MLTETGRFITLPEFLYVKKNAGSVPELSDFCNLLMLIWILMIKLGGLQHRLQNCKKLRQSGFFLLVKKFFMWMLEGFDENDLSQDYLSALNGCEVDVPGDKK